MTIEELKTQLNGIVALEYIGINVFFVMKDAGGLKKADIRRDATDELIRSVRLNIEGIVEEIESNDDMQVINLSEADDRSSVIYQYDLEETPETINYFNEINEHREPGYYSLDNGNVFSFDNDSLQNIDGYIIRFGDEDNYLMTYRKNYPVNVFKRDKIYLVLGDDTQFTTLQKDFLRIDAKIDFFCLAGTMFIRNIGILEKFHDFTRIITAKATYSLNQVQALNLVSNIEVLTERIGEIPFARKLTKISTNSPVFTLPKATIIGFAQRHRQLSNVFKYSPAGEIILDTKKSQNWFIRLLNDDFLHSELTNTDYLTPAKDKLE